MHRECVVTRKCKVSLHRNSYRLFGARGIAKDAHIDSSTGERDIYRPRSYIDIAIPDCCTQPQNQGKAQSNAKLPSVLVVEDDRESRFMITAILSLGNYSAQVSETRDEALELLEKNRFDVILLDLYMAGMSAGDYVRTVRARFPSTKLVLISAGRSIAEEAARLGIQKYLAKPFHHDALLRMLRECTK